MNITINSYTSVKLLPAKPASEGKKAPPRTVLVDGAYLTVWTSDLPALKKVVLAGEPIPVRVTSRAWMPEEGDEPRSVAQLVFAGGVSLDDEGEVLAVGGKASDE